jgi:hypothetical protein
LCAVGFALLIQTTVEVGRETDGCHGVE